MCIISSKQNGVFPDVTTLLERQYPGQRYVEWWEEEFLGSAVGGVVRESGEWGVRPQCWGVMMPRSSTPSHANKPSRFTLPERNV